MDWQIEVDEAMFLGGLPKGIFLREFEPDFFFDDQTLAGWRTIYRKRLSQIALTQCQV
jgi:hypothetical protein